MRVAAVIGERIRNAWDTDLAYSFRHDPVALLAAFLVLAVVSGAVLAPWIAPYDPFDLRQINLADTLLPPSWMEEGRRVYLLGTDDQGRDVLSGILFGARISLLVGVLSVVVSIAIGLTIGLASGYIGGIFDSFLMRVADVQLSFPAILIAMLVDGAARAMLPPDSHDRLAIPMLVVSIALSGWVQYARTVRGSTMVEKNKEYVHAARIIGARPLKVVVKHVLPNITGPVFVLATIHLATAIITEATLSFLGVGVPPTTPSLGTLIRIGNDYLFSGDWWITIFPGCALVVLVLATNLLGDWLRDALNPRLR